MEEPPLPASLDDLLARLASLLRDQYGLTPESVTARSTDGTPRSWPFPLSADGDPGGPPLTPCERAVLAAVRAQPGLFAEQIYAAVNPAPPREFHSLRTVHRALSSLKKRGLVGNPRRGAGYNASGK